MSAADGNGDDGDDGDGGGPGRREVAHRAFAAEFDDATVSYRESDEERAPNYVVTPTGLRVNRLFAVGVLTEVEPVNDEVVRARVADPTGAFVSYAGQYQPDPLAFFERTDPPAFVALTSKARTFEPDDGDRIYTSVRPESVNAVDADTRDRWVVGAAEATLERVAAFEAALDADVRGDDLRERLREAGHPESLAAGVPIAIERYGTTRAYLEAVRRTAVEALELVAGERDAVDGIDVAPDEGGDAEIGPTPASGTSLDATGADERDATGGTVAMPEADEADDVGAGAPADPATAEEPDESEASTLETAARDERVGGAEPEASTDAAGSGEAGADAAGADETMPGADAAGADEAMSETGTDAPEESTGAAGAGDDGSLGDFDAGSTASGLDEDEMYELDEEERREVEEEFGTEFSTGSEVDEPGEADIDVDVDVPDPAAADGSDEPASGPTGGDESGDGPADGGGDGSEEPADVDLEDAAVEAMADLDDGDGADREAVVASVVDAHGVDPGDVEDAIQDALMSGRCYEPDEGALKPI
ncbi:MAG: RPA family protein [Haloferacaceae archaeon]